MPKIDPIEILSKEEEDAGGGVGLSYSPYLTAKVHVKRYKTGETVIRCIPSYLLNLESRPPRNMGERVQENGLSRRGRRRIRRAAQLYQTKVVNGEMERAYTTMITLTYGKSFPDHATAKRHLDNLLKRLTRKKGGPIHYCWVAELQKRGAIHFHILTPEYIDKEWLNDAWNGVVNGYWKRSGQEDKVQRLLPHVFAVYNAGAYMSKYMSKEGHRIKGNGYNMSQLTSKALKPIFEDTVQLDMADANALLDTASTIGAKEALKNVWEGDTGVSVLWYSDTNPYLFQELVNHYLREPQKYASTEETRRETQTNCNPNPGGGVPRPGRVLQPGIDRIRERGTQSHFRISRKAQRAHRITRNGPRPTDHRRE